MSNIEQRLRKAIAQTFDIDEADLPSELSIRTLEQWDSLGHLQLIMFIESEFNIKFTTEKIPLLTSLEELKTEIYNASNS
jgi:acyl carrier protein